MITHGLSARILGLLALGIAILIALPLAVKSSFAIDIFIRILLFSFIGTAWNLMGGYAKQLSLGHAAYFGLGAYTSTILQIDFGISPWIGMIAGTGEEPNCFREGRPRLCRCYPFRCPALGPFGLRRPCPTTFRFAAIIKASAYSTPISLAPLRYS